MEILQGIIDEESNPFTCELWVNQNYRMTAYRKQQLSNLIGLTINEIRTLSINEGAYVAFIAIRWGYARLENRILVLTDL